ncbi:amino acid adenylation domain-containing protein [Paraflavitalea soli]|uniref:Amino acid adenylation domain-containing protein n=1 Tax=Paraflavitalea soli TaxID=2315862 RepID=A0A3B7MH26_9BACT|nr:non-ribosomal peptide synthetase/type I polyketide synthase [Paraflavitalea soli]AXY73694.1 amino acid adenylation domain-containing protein [Paraflavitalea soli]
MAQQQTGMEIAVIGISGRFPQSADPAALWENLVNGKECIDFFTKEALKAQGCDPAEVDHPAYVPANALLPDKDKFQPSFFGYSPKEAQVMAPQVRLLHELVWECLENAGYNPHEYADPIALYAGTSNSSYWESLTYISGLAAELGEFDAEHLNNKDTACAKVAYNLNLKGPVLAVHTECSTGLVAVHLAVKALLTGECRMALAGGVAVSYYSKGGYVYEEGMIRSDDGHCRVFDEKASGTMLGEGGGIVLLKRLNDAIRDGDHIYAVIKGSAVNNDGNEKVGFTAPSVAGQAEVIRRAQKMARINPADIRFIETHGTGTNLGDPIEVEALKLAFGEAGKYTCALGSLKSNIGHLGEGAGVAGLIKAVLALHKEVLPPSLHFETPNPKIGFNDSPFFVNNHLTPLTRSNGTPLLAGVSSFGIGGTNVHVVLEEYCEERKTKPAGKYELIPLSADNTWSLTKNLENLQTFMAKEPATNIANLAYTLQSGRKHFPVRTFLVGEQVEGSLEQAIAQLLQKPLAAKQTKPEKIVFLFPGQGTQYAGMTRDLYEGLPGFKQQLDACFALAAQAGIPHDLKNILFEDQSGLLNQTEITQLLLFIVEYALALQLMHLGIEPDILVGHSIGEYVAACIAGVFTPEEAIRIVARRGALMQQAPPGKMLSVSSPVEDLRPLLPASLSLAAVNSNNISVVSGTQEEIVAFHDFLEQREIPSRILVTSHAFHSPLMEPVLEAFEKSFETITLQQPNKTILSNLTGNYADPKELATAQYWVGHLRNTVQFQECLRHIPDNSLLIEVGPGHSLSTFARHNGWQDTINTIRHPDARTHDLLFYYQAIGSIWKQGIDINWHRFNDPAGRLKLPLPPYAFKRERYWIDEDPLALQQKFLQGADKEKKIPFEEWFHQPSWKQKHIDLAAGVNKEQIDHLLIFPQRQLFEKKEVIDQLQALKNTSITIVHRKGEMDGLTIPDNWVLIEESDNSRAFYDDLVALLQKNNCLPSHILHSRSIDGGSNPHYDYHQLITHQQDGLLNILHLAQALMQVSVLEKTCLLMVSVQQFLIQGTEQLAINQAPLQALNIVLPQEFHKILTKHIDFGSEGDLVNHIDKVLQETRYDFTNRTVAYRNGIRWLRSYEPVKLGEKAKNGSLKNKGVYLVTGGLGGVGTILAKYLAQTCEATLIMLSRTAIPEREEWAAILQGQQQAMITRIQRIQEIEALGGKVITVKADVGDAEAVAQAVAYAESMSGKINGVIHAAADTTGQSHVCFADQLSSTLVEEQFYAKVKGAMVLAHCFTSRQLDFFMVTSSLSAVLGGMGFLAYAASNAIVDQLLKNKNQQERGITRWITVNWDGWEEEQAPAAASQSYILPSEGAKAFGLILDKAGHNEVVVCTRDLDAKLRKWVYLEDIGTAGTEKDKETTLTEIQRAESLPEYLAPRNETEEKLVKAWQKIFGIKNIGINDNFFELGGDSLKAVVLANRIFKDLSVKISLQDLFQYTDIANLATRIKGVERAHFASIPPAKPSPYYNLSSAQKRFYYVYELDPASLAYNLPVVTILRGKLDKARFENAFRKLIRRHESLRTAFTKVNGQPRQLIAEEVSFSIGYLPGEKDKLEEAIEAFVKPFDLAVAPLMRAGLVEMEGEAYALLIDIHHIITDAESSEILVKDFMAFYNEATLPPLRIQYKDFTEWQQSVQQQQAIAAQQAFWLQEFRDGALPLEVPTDFPRPLTKTYQGDLVSFIIGKEQALQVRTLAEENGASVFMVLFAVFNILQHKLSNQEEIVIGTSTAGREHPDLEHVMGLFVNTLPVKCQVEGTLTFQQFLARVKTKVLTCFEQQSYPYDELVNQLNIERNTSRNLLFDVMFAYLNIQEAKLEFPGLTLSPYDFKHPVSKFDYTLQAYDNGEQIHMSIEYATDLFRRPTIERFTRYFNTILQTVTATPAIQVAAISMLDPAEKEDLLIGFNNTWAAFPDNKTIHQLIEEQVQRNPGRSAVVFNEQLLTYGQLNEKANRLAHYLRRQYHLQPGEPVLLSARLSPELLIALLAILKAGAAYLPVDPALPKERIRFIMEEAGVQLLITDEALLPHFDYYTGHTYTIDTTVETLDTPIEDPTPINTPNDLAYIIYTSGSTGQPKGVMVEHGSVVNYIHWAAAYYLNQPHHSFALFTSLSADLTVTSVFTPLITGHEIVIYRDHEQQPAVERIFREGRANVIKLTPSHLKIIRDTHFQTGENRPLLLKLIVGGEALETALARRIVQSLPGKVELFNEYGPTEATVGCMIHQYTDDEQDASVPIGLPIHNTRIYLLDKYLQPVAAGVTGELYVAGAGLARGYFNKEQLTAEKFIPNPFVPGTYMYKTGDHGVQRPDGLLSFRGRIDHQVKIRGYRVELSEIESRLVSYEGITDCLVLLHKAQQEASLVAYYVSTQETAKEALRDFLLQTLPDYMVPAWFIRLEAMPLMLNGKTDRKALPDPLQQRDTEYVMPVTEEEKALCEAWCEVLRIDKVGVLDKFFSLGGDSIKSIQICSKLQDKGYKFSVRDMLREQTIQKQALRMKKKDQPIHQAPITGTSRLSPIQQWFLDGPVADKHHFNHSILLHFPEGLTIETVTDIMGKLQEHHDALRMIFIQDLNGWHCENKGPGGPVAITEQDLREAVAPAEALGKLAQTIQSSIDLEQGPLMKLGLFHLPDGARLLIIIHHLVIDGVSWRILLDDIDRLHRQHTKKEPLSLPAKTLSFLHWIGKLDTYTKSKRFIQAAAWWKTYEVKPVTALPREGVGEKTLASMQQAVFRLNRADTTALLTKVQHPFGNQVNDMLLAALLLTLDEQWGIPAVSIELEGHGREDLGQQEDISRTVGWFTIQYPVWIEKGKDLRHTLKAVKEALHSLPNQGFDYLLQQYFTTNNNNGKRQLPAAPISFNYLGQFDESTEHNVFTIAGEPRGEDVSARYLSSFDWEFLGMVTGAQLELSVTYSTAQYLPATMNRFMDQYQLKLRELVAYCQTYPKKELTPSDFTYKHLTIEQVDALQSRYEIEDIYPLSPMQQGMLFHAIADPTSTAYFEQTSYCLVGHLNMEAVEKSLNALMARHPVLRTRFLYKGLEKPLQLVLKEQFIECSFTDIRGEIRNGSRNSVLQDWREADKAALFNLSEDALMRVTILQTATGEYEFIWSHHHIIMDGWCMGILINEFNLLYESFLHGQPIQLPPASPYATYIQWLEERDTAEAAHYWKDYLQGYHQLATIPATASLIAAADPYHPELAQLSFTREQTNALRALSVRYGVTVNTIIQVAWGILLLNYNRTRDVVFGCVVSGRPAALKGVDTMVGLFINTVPVRMTVEEDETLETFLQKVQANAIAGEPHHYHSLYEIQTQSQAGRSLLDHIMVFENYPLLDQLEQQGDGKPAWVVKDVQVLEETNYPLFLEVFLLDQLSIEIHYNARIYTRQEINELVRHLAHISDQVIHHSHKLVKDITIPLAKGLNGHHQPGLNVCQPELVEGGTRVGRLSEAAHPGQPLTPAATDTEKELALIWADLLKQEPEELDIHTSFFELGGHSLKALSLVNRINKQFGIQIELQTIFDKETIRNLAEEIITIRQIQYGVKTDEEGFEVVI